MLKIKAPIQTKVKADLCGSYENFTERIRGNYQQIGHYMESTDLLHLVTQPPEIFLMEGGDTMFANETNIENRQIQKVEIINNLVNRILVSADGSLHYQDRVYISNILHQLGIHDDRKFMREVRKAFQETREQNELINLYWNNMIELRNMVSTYQEENETTLREERSELNQEVLHLHEEVNARLQTGAIYQMLQSFASVNYNPRNITEQQYQLSESTRLSREILLQRLRENVRGEKQPLIYRHENVYEGTDLTENEITVENVSERVTSAVLLNLLDNIYQASYEYIDHKMDNWFRADAAYYQSAENTLSRIENNTAYIQYLREVTNRTENEVEESRNELSILNQILDLRRWSDTRIQPSVGGNLYETTAENVHLRSGDTVTEEGDTTVQTGLTHVTREGDQVTSETTLEGREENLRQQLYQTYQQNIARNEKYMQNLRQIIEQYRPGQRETVTREEMQRNALEALEHPEQFLESIREEGTKEREEQEALARAVEAALPRDQQIVNRLIRQYIEAPEEERRRMAVSVNNQSLLFYDIYQATPEGERERLLQAAETAPKEPAAMQQLAEDAGQGKEGSGGEQEAAREMIRQINERQIERRERETAALTEAELIHRARIETENEAIVKEITERVIERWRGVDRARENAPETMEERETISFIHRSVENEISEEDLDEIRQEIRRNRETVQRNISEERTTETTNVSATNTVTNQVIEQNEEEIQRLINRTVRRQMDTITEKVYGRIEKQLQNERRRRGL